MRFPLLAAVSAALLTLAACATPFQAAPPEPVADAQPMASAADLAFDALVDEITTEILAESPELATYLGVDEAIAGGPYLARLSDYGPAGRERARELTRDAFSRLADVDVGALDDQRRLTRTILLEILNAGAAADRAALGWGDPGLGAFSPYVVTQLTGLHIDLPNLLQAQQPVTSAEEAAAYVERLAGFPDAFDGAIESIRVDADAGVVPPDFVIQKTLDVIARFTAPPPRENVLYVAFASKLADAGVVDTSYLVQVETLIETEVYPAYERLAAVLEELLPRAAHAAGIDQQPGGAAVYSALIRVNADSELSPDDIHEIGLAEVDRIMAEMERILVAEGYVTGTIGERIQALSEEPRFLYPNTDEGKAQLIADLNAHIAEVQALAPEWFGVIPPQPVEVRRVPVFSEESAPGGYYDLPSLDGTRPGVYWINLRDTAYNPSFGLPTLTHHEAVPGHHYQIALTLDLDDVPLLRKVAGITTAYVEGWALYSEQVAVEMGLYEDDPFGDLGRLQSELFRAVRLVVDTGLHEKGWSREEAIDYMVATGAETRANAIVEIERYAAMPGQALGYKMGMLKFLELRAEAEAALGDAFDVRAFHDAVLLDGGMPMPVLEQRMDAWVAEQRSLASAATTP